MVLTNIVGRLLFSIVPFGWMSKVDLTTEQLSIGVNGDDDAC